MSAIDDPWPEEDYHGLDDEPSRIDAEKAARIARLLFHLGLEIGNSEERPRWNPESYERIVTDPAPGASR